MPDNPEIMHMNKHQILGKIARGLFQLDHPIRTAGTSWGFYNITRTGKIVSEYAIFNHPKRLQRIKDLMQMLHTYHCFYYYYYY